MNKDENKINVLHCQKEIVQELRVIQCGFEEQRKKWLFSGWGQDEEATCREGCTREMTVEADFERWAEFQYVTIEQMAFWAEAYISVK